MINLRQILYLSQVIIIKLTVKWRKERLEVLDSRNTEVKNMFNVIRLLKIYNLTDVYRWQISLLTLSLSLLSPLFIQNSQSLSL